MTVTYKKLLETIKLGNEVINKTNKNYILNEHNAIIASYDKNSISMYYRLPVINNNQIDYQIVLVTFVKNFKIYDKVADVIFTNILDDKYNDIEITDNIGYKKIYNPEINEIKKSNFMTNPKRLLFEYPELVDNHINVTKELLRFDNCGNFYQLNKDTFDYVIGTHRFDNIDNTKINIINYKQAYNNYYRHEIEEYLFKTYQSRDFSNYNVSVVVLGNPYELLLDVIYNSNEYTINQKRDEMHALLRHFNVNPKMDQAFMAKYNFDLINQKTVLTLKNTKIEK